MHTYPLATSYYIVALQVAHLRFLEGWRCFICCCSASHVSHFHVSTSYCSEWGTTPLICASFSLLHVPPKGLEGEPNAVPSSRLHTGSSRVIWFWLSFLFLTIACRMFFGWFAIKCSHCTQPGQRRYTMKPHSSRFAQRRHIAVRPSIHISEHLFTHPQKYLLQSG